MLNSLSQKAFSVLPGLGLVVAIAAASHLLSLGHTALDPLVLAMLASIVVGNLFGPRESLGPGISLSHRTFIPLGIILYGTQMDAHPLLAYGMDRVLHILLMVVIGLFSIVWISDKLGISRTIGLLLAAGSSICGASAIMVLSPVIKAKQEDTSISLLAITVVGLSGVILYPLALVLFSLPENLYALLCGSTLFQVGQVRAAAAFVGPDAVEMALPVKLLRVTALLPVAVAYSLLKGREGRRIYVPWFIVGFIITAALSNLLPALAVRRAALAPYGAFCFSLAVAAIGLTVDIESIIDVGPRPLLAAFLGWIVIIALFVLGVAFIR